jgi:hypothetical protein
MAPKPLLLNHPNSLDISTEWFWMVGRGIHALYKSCIRLRFGCCSVGPMPIMLALVSMRGANAQLKLFGLIAFGWLWLARIKTWFKMRRFWNKQSNYCCEC